MSRRRRCAFDSDNLEEYIQLATIGQNQTNLFYDDKKLKWVNGLKQVADTKYTPKQIEGFEHGHSQNDYIDTSELPPDIHLKSSDEVINHHIMILGDINECLKQSLTMFCMQSRKNSNEDFNEELISPLKNKLCLDLAIKRIQERDGVHMIKFLMHDTSISDYAPIINGKLQFYFYVVYFLQTSIYILAFDVDSKDFEPQKEQDMISYVKERAVNVKNIYSVYFTDQDISDQRQNKYFCNRWSIGVILSQIIEQVITQ
ncbi:unnamed protein product (macronuclear) [Paramecium tetraurelia]|uniref:Uncharacterized protein n=1 Tax=Paramecium tetraurelia TaxID=5888 RepID=A0DQ60_PARTE|nr:uncharacterized protein GSPATT00002577001 [Paramecium tetraurelia]CAK85177.1 unnamed protein product [Paramecium tetraurelia]|eukprot:XP_001452574.1 hypothetical protein (macronuclear) [Paramecium tetraurelia strain d4-2]